jgi:hypothetical protein
MRTGSRSCRSGSTDRGPSWSSRRSRIDSAGWPQDPRLHREHTHTPITRIHICPCQQRRERAHIHTHTHTQTHTTCVPCCVVPKTGRHLSFLKYLYSSRVLSLAIFPSWNSLLVYSRTDPSPRIAHTALASQYVFLLRESCFRQCTGQGLGSATSSNRERIHMIKGTEWRERRSYKKKETIHQQENKPPLVLTTRCRQRAEWG